ncbi:MAG: DUF3800 domain-containing protein [Candidatus Latescibacteria bacterium]|nr:DUF3800 domain-containing protein [Candidatus Latescibacterota bacterium]
MFIAYYDESGDDGYPMYSSPLFVLTSLYFNHLHWQNNYKDITDFRRLINSKYGLPVKIEMHTKQFLLNKKPYRNYGFSDNDRIQVIDQFCDFISKLDVKIINVVINKLLIQTADYMVLDRALTYSIQRIENDLKKINPASKFMIITDEGRLGKMRNTARKIQKFNLIPSKYGHTPIRQEIKSLIEDPLPKSSKESYFIQLADVIAYIVYLYSIINLGVGRLANRLPEKIVKNKIEDWMDKLKGSINLEASAKDKYGIVSYPK